MSAHPTFGLRRERLPNGVTLLVQRRRTAPAAALVTMVRAGFLDEPDPLAGASHVLEHMIFKGTPTVGPGELARRTKGLGGALNAYTSYDRTAYFATVPAANAGAALALQVDAVRNAQIDPEELRRELGVIIQEARRKFDTPSAVAGETLHELLFDHHRIRRWRIGTEAALEGFTRDDIAGYHAARYVPDRTIAVIVGDIDEEQALDLLRAQWSDWDRPSVPVASGPVEDGIPTVRARRMSGDVAQAELIVGWRVPGPLHDDVPALELGSALLASGRGARLTRLLRDPGVVSGVGAGVYGAEDAGVFVVSAELDPSRTDEALAVVGGAVRTLASLPADPAELERVRTMLQMRLRRGLERFESRAIALATAEAMGDVHLLDQREQRLLDVTSVKVRDVAAQYLRADMPSAVGYFPNSSSVAFDADRLRNAMAGAPIAIAAPIVPLPPSQKSTAAPASRHHVHGVFHLAAPGLDILVARHGDVPQVSLGVWRRRTEMETAADAGLAALAVRSMVRGTISHDSAQLAIAVESLGGSLGASLGADVLGFGTTVLAEHAGAASRLLASVLTAPRFDHDTVEIERAILLDDARAVADDSVRFPMQLVLGAAFDGVGYGAPPQGTVDSLAALSHEAVCAWHRRLLGGGRTTVVAVGDGDPERLADRLLDAFDDLTAEGPRAELVLPAQPMRSARSTEHRERKQSAFAMLFPGPSRTDPDRFAAEVWAAIAGGLGGRLFEALRDRRSLAYTVMASSWQRRSAGGLLTYIAMAPERIDEARDAMLEELEAFRVEPPSLDDTRRAAAMLAGQASIARQSAGSLASEIADAWLQGEGLIELDDPGGPYRAVTAGDVYRVAQASLDPSRRSEGVLDARGVPVE